MGKNYLYSPNFNINYYQLIPILENNYYQLTPIKGSKANNKS